MTNDVRYRTVESIMCMQKCECDETAITIGRRVDERLAVVNGNVVGEIMDVPVPYIGV